MKKMFEEKKNSDEENIREKGKYSNKMGIYLNKSVSNRI